MTTITTVQADTKRIVTLPNGRAVRLGSYVASWKTLKTTPPDTQIRGWDYFETPAEKVLRELRFGMHDRINRHVPWYGKGRKWAAEWQNEMWRASRQLNQPRLVIHWLPPELRQRFAHRTDWR